MKKLKKEHIGEYQTYPEKVLQFGTGNFLRGFTGWIVDRMNKQADFNGSIVIVQSTENGQVNKINEQDGLYTLYLQGIADGNLVKEHQVISSISRGLNVHKEYDEYLAIAKNPNLRFVFSNTTEAGIYMEESDQLSDRPQKSFVGKLTAFLFHRFQAFNGDRTKGLLIIPCELIEKNGKKIKEIILQHSKRWNLGKEFSDWVEEANTFCDTLVDRIVPGFPKDAMEELKEELGYQDDLTVVGEPYHLWAIQGPEWLKEDFPAEKIGLNVRVVDDITPYRASKVRILNGAHTAMTPIAYLYGLDTVLDVMENAEMRSFVESLIKDEIIPTLNLPKDELQLFAKEVVDRFSNPFIKHQLSSIALNAMAKFKTRNLPTLIAYAAEFSKLPEKMSFSLSAWIVFYKGIRNGENFKIVDEEYIVNFFDQLWASYTGTEEDMKEIAFTVLGNEKIWGQDLNQIPGLTDTITKNILTIEELGMKNSLKQVQFH